MTQPCRHVHGFTRVRCSNPACDLFFLWCPSCSSSISLCPVCAALYPEGITYDIRNRYREPSRRDRPRRSRSQRRGLTSAQRRRYYRRYYHLNDRRINQRRRDQYAQKKGSQWRRRHS